MRRSKAAFFIAAAVCAICLLFGFISPSWGAPEAATAETGSVRAGDIDIAYRVLGEGEPLLLITGYAATMDMWDPTVIGMLAARYKVILFDNRGVGATTATDKPFSIELFARDALGLLDGLKVKKAHVLGWSMGSFIALELAVNHPDRVGKLVIYGGNCVWQGKEVVAPRPEVPRALLDVSGTDGERSKRLVPILFPEKWLDDHPDFLKSLPRPASRPSIANVARQGKAIVEWPGACGRLPEIKSSTLLVTGTEDVIIPPANSMLMASKIPGSWLIRLPGGHSNMYQYPEDFGRCLLAFLGAREE